MSDGTFETENFWQSEKDGIIAFYNGSAETKAIRKESLADSYCLLYGTAKLHLADELLFAEILPHSLLVLSENDGTQRGFLKEGILHLTPVEGGTVQCEEDAFAAQYLFYDGKPELIGIYRNGDILLDGEGTVRFFCWENMRPKE